MTQAIIAPDINWPEMRWVNFERSISLSELRGKIVVLYFWTASSTACHNLFPTLAQIERQYAEEVAVIGVHTPKFGAERSLEAAKAAVERFGLRHPIIHDPDKLIWRLYAVKTWPTLVFIGADGRLIGQVGSEPDSESLLNAVSQIVQKAYRNGQLKLTPVPRVVPPLRDTRLYFPTSITEFPQDNAPAHFVISDTGHHQLVIVDNQGREQRRIGAGQGFRDGEIDQAEFNRPMGLFFHRGSIYVADSANHALRRVDFRNGIVTTIAGTGRRGSYLGSSTHASGTSLATPTDLCIAKGQILFTNTGTHQLGRYDFSSNAVSSLAGSGHEGLTDGYALSSALARPACLVLDSDKGAVYFSDAETSSIRRLSIAEDIRVTTLIGSGAYDFGHVNGPFIRARFQQPLGMTLYRSSLIVADTYNHTLREVNLDTQMVYDFRGMEYKNSDYKLYDLNEPTDVITINDREVLCVDRNNHRVVIFDPHMRVRRTWVG